ncbi:hypothetical protein ES702_07436 [subsurface metagenome]
MDKGQSLDAINFLNNQMRGLFQMVSNGHVLDTVEGQEMASGFVEEIRGMIIPDLEEQMRFFVNQSPEYKLSSDGLKLKARMEALEERAVVFEAAIESGKLAQRKDERTKLEKQRDAQLERARASQAGAMNGQEAVDKVVEWVRVISVAEKSLASRKVYRGAVNSLAKLKVDGVNGIPDDLEPAPEVKILEKALVKLNYY